jgi:hypothetical protein
MRRHAVDEFDEFVLFDDRGNERLVCPDCLAVCAPQTPVRCDKDWCCCDCNQELQAKTFNTQEVDEETAGHSVGVDDIHSVIHTP